MATKEAHARIKINKLLEAAGWRFFAEGGSAPNIQLEPSVTLKTQEKIQATLVRTWGDDEETTEPVILQ